MDESELARLHQTVRAPGWRRSDSFAFRLPADVYARAGMPGRGLAALAEIPEHARETVLGPEIHRSRGELLLSQGDAHTAEAETCFRSAMDLARRRGLRSLELRAATSLSRLLGQQGHREDARLILADLYGWFSEGLETGDLRTARQLLDSLR